MRDIDQGIWVPATWKENWKLLVILVVACIFDALAAAIGIWVLIHYGGAQ